MNKERSWQDNVLFCSLFILIIFYFFLFSNFAQFPSEIYGGDHYQHFGSVIKIYETLNPFVSSHYANELSHYPWFTPFVMALIAKVTFINPFTLGIYFPIISMLAAALVTYYFGKEFFANKTWGLILTITWVVSIIPSFHPSEISKFIFMPLLAFLIVKILKAKTKKEFLLIGILYGIMGLQHLVTFVMATIAVSLAFILRWAQEYSKEKKNYSIKETVLSMLIAIVIASLFWLPILIKYQGKTLNDWQQYSVASLLPSQEFLLTTLFDIIKYDTRIKTTIAALLLCFTLCYVLKNTDKKIFAPLLLLSATLLGIMHPYITMPLFDVSLGYYRFPIAMYFIRHLFVVLGLFYFWTWSQKILKDKIKSKTKESNQGHLKKALSFIAVILLIVWVATTFLTTTQSFKESERYGYATTYDPTVEVFRKFQEESNVLKGQDIVLTSFPDVSFMFNGVTGKNVFVTRRTHASAFVDHDKRIAELAVILYGTNRGHANELIEKNKITHYLEHNASAIYNQLCVDNWDLVSMRTEKQKTVVSYPCLKVDPKYGPYLKENGIITTTGKVRLAVGEKDVPVKKMIIIKPSQIKLEATPIDVVTGKTEEIRLYSLS